MTRSCMVLTLLAIGIGGCSHRSWRMRAGAQEGAPGASSGLGRITGFLAPCRTDGGLAYADVDSDDYTIREEPVSLSLTLKSGEKITTKTAVTFRVDCTPDCCFDAILGAGLGTSPVGRGSLLADPSDNGNPYFDLEQAWGFFRGRPRARTNMIRAHAFGTDMAIRIIALGTPQERHQVFLRSTATDDRVDVWCNIVDPAIDAPPDWTLTTTTEFLEIKRVGLTCDPGVPIFKTLSGSEAETSFIVPLETKFVPSLPIACPP